MKTLIIPDIHLAHAKVDAILNLWQFDKVVFLADYFDDWGDNVDKTKEMARWLKKQLNELGDKAVFLMGNHDMPYRFPKNQFLMCPGWSPEKSEAVNSVLTHEDWARFKLFHHEQGFFLSHGGISPYIFAHPTKGITQETVQRKCDDAIECAKTSQYCWYIGVGRGRGGPQSFGGITWLDWNEEFQPIEDVNQIVGHTPHAEPQEKYGKNSENYALDTRLHHVAFLEDGKVDIQENDF